MENKIFKCYAIIDDRVKSWPKPKDITIGKKYPYHMDISTPGGYFNNKILNDKKEWMVAAVDILVRCELVTTKCKVIKELIANEKGDIIDIVLSIDKKTFLYCCGIYNTKEYLKIL
ncbi:MAG: hypothetical protein [Caudoviricetes sp.]|nr:MAG: hypothetical protein [Caudoviricetes sp.]